MWVQNLKFIALPITEIIGGTQGGAIISGTGKATECKFGRYIDMKNLAEKGVWVLGIFKDCPNFFEYPYYFNNG